MSPPRLKLLTLSLTYNAGTTASLAAGLAEGGGGPIRAERRSLRPRPTTVRPRLRDATTRRSAALPPIGTGGDFPIGANAIGFGTPEPPDTDVPDDRLPPPTKPATTTTPTAIRTTSMTRASTRLPAHRDLRIVATLLISSIALFPIVGTR
jgi:hypothetical protein